MGDARCSDCGRTGRHLAGCLYHPDPTQRHPFAWVLDDFESTNEGEPSWEPNRMNPST